MAIHDFDSLFVPDSEDCPFAPGQCRCEWQAPDPLSPIHIGNNQWIHKCTDVFDDGLHLLDNDDDLFGEFKDTTVHSDSDIGREDEEQGAPMTNVSSLQDLALKACVRNSTYLSTVGDIPYKVVRPILLSIENADQLHRIELSSPQIVGEDAEIWKKLIKRDTLNGNDQIVEPRDPANWYKVYRKLKKLEDKSLASAEKALKARFKEVSGPNEAHKMNTIASIPQLGTKRGAPLVLGGNPDQPKILKYSRSTGKVMRPGYRSASAFRNVNTPGNIVRNVNMPSLSRPSTAGNTGRSVLDRARQDAKIVKTYRQATPSHMLNTLSKSTSQIKSVPKTLLSPAAARAKATTNVAPSSSHATQTSQTPFSSKPQSDQGLQNRFVPSPTVRRVTASSRPAVFKRA